MSVMRTITQRQTQSAGMALGGIGTGSVEILPDGRLQDFHVVNLGKWAAARPEKHGLADLPGYTGDVLPFYVRVKEQGKPPVVRKLSHNSQSGGFRSLMYSWMKEVAEISWTPTFPVCQLSYNDPALPIKITADFVSPFVPHNSKISATPGFYVNFQVTNTGDVPIEVSLLGTLKNPVNRGYSHRMLQNTLLQQEGATILTMASSSQEKYQQNGSMSLSVLGGKHSYILGDFETFFGAHVQGGTFGGTEESCLFDFQEQGQLTNLGWSRADEALLALTQEQVMSLEGAELDKTFDALTTLASAARPMKRINEVSPALLKTPQGKQKFIHMVLNCYRHLHEDFTDNQWGGGALCSQLTLLPLESQTIGFALAWHFPNHYSAENRFVGHQYAKWFEDATAVSLFLWKNAQMILEKTKAFSTLLQNTDTDPAFARSWITQLSTIVKCSWWSAEGAFGIWEGYGSCGFHTTDISYYGSFGLLALFPELELKQMEMTTAFQRDDGRIPHFFTPDFTKVDDGFDRVDMNPQFVLLVCRDYLWTGDKAYLQRMWQAVIRAMENSALLDSDGDGLPDRDTHVNTYDAWRFRGIPAYIAGLWLAALAAAVRLAEAMGDTKYADHWQGILEKGKASYVEKLWNGSYFSLWVDGAERDECCMSGQLDGLWYAKLLGLPAILEDSYIHKAVASILSNNFHSETGLVNASYPKGSTLTLYTHRNVQADANWSGVEFGFAGFLLELGKNQLAKELTQTVEQRHYLAGRMFNHEECGEYYYRALSSWTLLLSLGGFKPDMEKGCLTLMPTAETITLPWFMPQGFGQLTQKGKQLTLYCAQGKLSLQELHLKETMLHAKAYVDGVLQQTTSALNQQGICCLRFAESITLTADSSLSIQA